MRLQKLDRVCECGGDLYLDLDMNFEFCLLCMKNGIERGLVVWDLQ